MPATKRPLVASKLYDAAANAVLEGAAVELLKRFFERAEYVVVRITALILLVISAYGLVARHLLGGH